MKSYYFLTLCLISTFVCQSQSTIAWGKEKINRIDENNQKQGKWVFFEASQAVAMVCEYRNDTIAGNRTFYANNQPLIIREPRGLKVNKKMPKSKPVFMERFTYLKNSKKILGYYDKAGKVFLDSKADTSYKNDIQNLYIKEIPSIYNFGFEDLNVAIAELMGPIKKPASNKSDGTPPEPTPLHVMLVELSLNANGKVENAKIINEKSEYEGPIMAAFMSMKRWQPAFRTWITEPSGTTLPFNF